jgi:hypothetical protein
MPPIVVQTRRECGGSFAEQVFELGEHHLDRTEIGRVFLQQDQLGADVADGLADRQALVAAQIVHGRHLAAAQRRGEHPFNVDAEALAVDRAVEQPGRIAIRSCRKAAMKVIVFQ